jgi:hypothetical protein
LRERRVDVRGDFAGGIELTGAAGSRRALARDLSRAGLGARLAAPHPEIGASLEAEFRLPGFVLPILARVRVAWSDPQAGRLGLRFSDLESAVGELIERFVAGGFGGG